MLDVVPEAADDWSHEGWVYDDETGQWYETGQGYEAGEWAAEHGLVWVLSWTVVGTLLPGVGLLRAGRRTLGLLTLLLAAGGTAFALYSRRDLDRILFGGGLDPQTLLGAAVLVGAVGVFLVAVLIATNVALMRHTAGGVWTRAGNRTLLVLLAGGVAVPAYGTVINLLLTRASLLAALESTPYG